MYEFFKKIGKVFTSKLVGTGPSSYKTRIYRATVSQMLRNTVIDSSDFLLWGRLKSIVYPAQIENEGTLFQLVFYSCQSIRSSPGTFERMPIRT